MLRKLNLRGFLRIFEMLRDNYKMRTAKKMAQTRVAKGALSSTNQRKPISRKGGVESIKTGGKNPEPNRNKPGAEQRSASRSREQDREEHMVNKNKARIGASKVEGYWEQANLKFTNSHQIKGHPIRISNAFQNQETMHIGLDLGTFQCKMMEGTTPTRHKHCNSSYKRG